MPSLLLSDDPITSFDPELIIYVEGPSDQELLKHKLLCKIIEQYDRDRQIKLSISLPSSGTGCSAVINDVKHQTAAGKAVFGILDRDVFFRDRKLEILLEVDDTKFREQAHLETHENIWCLTHWEFENYLLCDIDALEAVLAHRPGYLRRLRSQVEVLGDLFGHAELIFLKMSANLLLQKEDPSRKKLAAEFGRPENNPSKLKSTIADHLKSIFAGVSIDVEKALDENSAKLSAFMAEASKGSLEAWLKTCRILDGKMVLASLFHGPNEIEAGIARIAYDIGLKLNIADLPVKEFIDAINFFHGKFVRATRAQSQ